MGPTRQSVPLRLAFFAGGNGSAMKAVKVATDNGTIRSRVALLATNRPGCGARAWAHKHGISIHDIDGDSADEPVDEALCKTLVRNRIDLILLTGYMRKLGPRVLDRFRPSILNTHPALLPKFGGLGMFGSRVHKAVLAAGETNSGATVHIVDGTYDTGPILRQKSVDIDINETPDTLADKVKSVEIDLLLEILYELESKRLNLKKFVEEAVAQKNH